MCFQSEIKTIGLRHIVNEEKNHLYWHFANIVIDNASRIYNQIEKLCRAHRSAEGPLRSHWHTDCFVDICGY